MNDQPFALFTVAVGRRGGHLVGVVGVGLALEQQPYYRLMAVLGSQAEGRGSALPEAAMG